VPIHSTDIAAQSESFWDSGSDRCDSEHRDDVWVFAFRRSITDK